MARLSWISAVPNLPEQAEALIRDPIEQAGGPEVAGTALYRKNDQMRTNAKMDP